MLIMSNRDKKFTKLDEAAILKSYHDGIKYLREYNDEEFKVIARELYNCALESGRELSYEMRRELYARDINPKELLN